MTDATHVPGASPQHTDPPPVEQERVRVLIVDDHLLVADSIAAALSATEGMDVVGVAGSCAAGLQATSSFQPDVLLLDQRLPDGLGTDLLPELFEACPSVRILLVTAESSDAVLLNAIERGCTGFVRKGARAAELVEAVRSAARNETVIAAEDLRRLLPRFRIGQRRGDDLTKRERGILQLLVEGASTAGIASELEIAVATTRNHVQAVLLKLGAHSRLEAVAVALREGIATLPPGLGPPTVR